MPEKIMPGSPWNLPPTMKQMRRISLLCGELGFQEPSTNKPTNRLEARTMIYGLKEEKRKRAEEAKHGL